MPSPLTQLGAACTLLPRLGFQDTCVRNLALKKRNCQRFLRYSTLSSFVDLLLLLLFLLPVFVVRTVVVVVVHVVPRVLESLGERITTNK